MRHLIAPIALVGLLAAAAPSHAQFSISIATPGASIGFDVGDYPELVPVPGYPVYYAPDVDGNYFFYDGIYWLYQGDAWYSSSWYNGPWQYVDPDYVPLYILRVPVIYYRAPPVYFRGWDRSAPPRWHEHWGRGWEERHGGWDHWDRSSAPPPAPLPHYQREYRDERYPRAPEEQHAIRSDAYRYQPQEPVSRQHYEAPAARPAPPVQEQRYERPTEQYGRPAVPQPVPPVARPMPAPTAKPAEAAKPARPESHEHGDRDRPEPR
jgi:hypothetical protein